MKRENYIQISGWMVTDLHLKGNELLCYAIIYGFSQIEGTKFSGSMQYLAEWCGSTRQTIYNCLVSLVEKGLISKSDKVVNGIKLADYYVNQFDRVSKNFTGDVKNFDRGCQKILHHNNKDILEDNNEEINTSVFTKKGGSFTKDRVSEISLLLNDKSFFTPSEDKVAYWSSLYPSVDIRQELRKMSGWCVENDKKRKTKGGIGRFINGWLAKEQDKYKPSSSWHRGESNTQVDFDVQEGN